MLHCDDNEVFTSQDQHKINDLQYSFAKRVPDMMRGFTITTCYGEINIPAEHAAPFCNLVSHSLQQELDKIIKL